jgi:hypothetical protein
MGLGSLRPPAKEELRIFWDGEEVPGFVAYGLRALHGESPHPPDVGVGSESEARLGMLHGPGWEIFFWDVHVPRWPDPVLFRDQVRVILQDISNAGFVVAWIAVEGCFAEPPDLFLSESMSGCVLAAFSEANGFQIAVDLDRPIRFLGDAELTELRATSMSAIPTSF